MGQKSHTWAPLSFDVTQMRYFFFFICFATRTNIFSALSDFLKYNSSSLDESRRRSPLSLLLSRNRPIAVLAWVSPIPMAVATRHAALPLGTAFRARICKRLRSPGIDFKKSIPPAYVAWRAGTSKRVVVPARQARTSTPGLLKKGLKIRALTDERARGDLMYILQCLIPTFTPHSQYAVYL
jgi:hypothetical protein